MVQVLSRCVACGADLSGHYCAECGEADPATGILGALDRYARTYRCSDRFQLGREISASPAPLSA
jgi:hypothetical protein